MAFYQGKKYSPVKPQIDGEDVEWMERLILRHGHVKSCETQMYFVDANTGIYSGWVIGVIRPTMRSEADHLEDLAEGMLGDMKARKGE